MKKFNWNEVQVGETEIVNNGYVWLVLAIRDNDVWVHHQQSDRFDTFTKAHIEKYYIIHERLVEITTQCVWRPVKDSGHEWVVWYRDEVIGHSDRRFRFSGDGRYVWKREEGTL